VLMTLRRFTYESGKWYVDANGRKRKEQGRGCNQIHVLFRECGVGWDAQIVIVLICVLVRVLQRCVCVAFHGLGCCLHTRT